MGLLVIQTIRKVLELLSAKERQQLYRLLPAVIIAAVIEVAGIAAVMPFLTLLAQPEVVDEPGLLNNVYSWLGFENHSSFLMFVGFMVLVVLTVSNGFAMLMTWLLMRFTWMRNHSISRRLLIGYLQRPYSFFLNRNSSELSKNILAEVQQVVLELFVPGVRMLTRIVAAAFIIILLLLVNPLLAISSALLLGGTYAAIFALVRHRLSRLGKQRVMEQRQRFKLTNETFTSIKDIKLYGKEADFLERYSRPSEDYARHSASSFIIAAVPRYALETIAFGVVILIVLFYLAQGSLQQVLPIVGLYAFATYRLLPALQSIFEAISKLQFNLAALNAIHQDMQQLSEGDFQRRESIATLPFQDKLELRSVSYHYPAATTEVLSGLNLSIRANSSVAFVGSTGSGKTTVVDILLGLLQPQSGGLWVDGVKVGEETLANWQKNLGYVAQTIALSDDSVLQNIAFGVPAERIDYAAVVRAAKAAQLHDFVLSEMPEGYDTIVGEQGIRLSGGQRQRLGIARALYHDPSVLILDEATSALDTLTERKVMEAIQQLSGSKTLIMIAHRLSTVQHCDCIFYLERGQVLAQGSYQELLVASSEFGALSRAAQTV